MKSSVKSNKMIQINLLTKQKDNSENKFMITKGDKGGGQGLGVGD